MRRIIPDGFVARLVFVSGLLWILFGVVLFFALAAHMFGARLTTFPGLELPFFGMISLGMDVTVGWLHVMGFMIAPLLCVGVGLAICSYGSSARAHPHA
jgi:hypothetical protein